MQSDQHFVDLCKKCGFDSNHDAKSLESFERKSSMIWFKFLTGYSGGWQDGSNCRSGELIKTSEGVITVSQVSHVLA